MASQVSVTPDCYTIQLAGRTYKWSPAMGVTLAQTEKASILPGGADRAHWRTDISICRLRSLSYLYAAGKMRDSDGSPECSHAHEAAHFVYNCKQIDPKLPRIVRAFTMQGHDLVEDTRGRDYYDAEGYLLPPLTAALIVEVAWAGDPAWAPFLIQKNMELTDQLDLPRDEKPIEQARIANADPTLLLPHGRFADKFFPFLHDYRAIQTMGYMPVKGVAHFVNKMERKWETIRRLNISPVYKAWYTGLAHKCLIALDKQARRGPGVYTPPRSVMLDTWCPP